MLTCLKQFFLQGESVDGGEVERPDHQAGQPRRPDHLGGHLSWGERVDQSRNICNRVAYQDIVDEMDEIAPMLAKMGYDPDANPPNYGVPDGIVANNTKEVKFALISTNNVTFLILRCTSTGKNGKLEANSW